MLAPTRRLLAWTLLSLALSSCRKGSDNQSGSFIPVLPSSAGTQGCGPSAPVPGSLTPVFASAAIGPLSQIAAASDAETLYLTGADGSIHELVFPGPTDSVLVAAGVIENQLLVPAGILAPAELSGITVFDAQFLIVAEHASNTLLSVRRDVPDSVALLAGLPLAVGGYADGVGGAIRFHFTEPVPLLASAFGTVYVGDTENHAIRLVAVAGIPAAATLLGTGAPGNDTGALVSTQLDTPSGIATNCAGELLVLESGLAGVAGRRLLSLAVGGVSIFTGFDGSSLVLAGDGTDASTQGVDTAAQLGTPQGLVATQDGLLYWVDAKEGVLRRYDVSSGLSDCPLFADCAAAVTAGGSFSGTHFSLALGASGSVYVLEADAGALQRVDP
ncbi:MAG: hypothetical protein EXS08_07880 [Planctomycetes bacterium]|nr:hypothetical protein [Planctomycetota bacterium]